MDRILHTVRQFMVFRSQIAIIGVVIGIGLIWWFKRRGRRGSGRVREAFQDKTPPPNIEDIVKDIPIPSEVSSPEPVPTAPQEYCQTIKKALDALRLTEINKKMNEYVASQEFKAMKSDMEDKFRTQGCEEYLDKIRRGEIPAPQTPTDMKPPPPTEAA